MTIGRRGQSGVSLLEVLISVLVLAIGILGIAALQAITLKNSGMSASRTQAAIQIYSIFDTIRASRDDVTPFNTNTYVTVAQSGDVGTLDNWIYGLKATVAPDAQAKVLCNQDTLICTVGVRWTEERASGGAAQPNEIELTTRI